MKRVLLLLTAAGALLLGGCAAPGQQEGDLLNAANDISELYSQVSLRAQMAFTKDDERPCEPDECARRAAFDQRVVALGGKLAEAAYRDDPELKERMPKFNFKVLDKAEPGSGSTAGGNVVLLRPVSELVWSDEALSFVLAREMGHVIAKHHQINTGTSIAVSVAVAILAPAVGLAKLLAVLYSSSSASTAASGISNIASFAGSRAIIATYWPTQRQSADALALKLMTSARMDYSRVPAGMTPACTATPSTRWTRELDDSVAMAAAFKPAPTDECARPIVDETAAILTAAAAWPPNEEQATPPDAAPDGE